MSTERAEVKIKETLRSSQFDNNFPKEIMKYPGGEKLYLCYQCGSCVGGCPVGKITDSYRPRQIIKMALLGIKNEVLSSNSIWLCASCYTCQERCPQEVEIADLMLALRNLAAKEGYAPKALVDQALSLIESGRIAKITGLTEQQRSSFGLPKVPSTSLKAVKKIVARTGFDKLVEKLKEAGQK